MTHSLLACRARMQGITCVKNEIHNNLAQLRLTSRHSDSGVSLSLKHAFKALFDSLSESKVDSLLHIDVRKCLSPFLLIITSKTSTLEQTLLALQSVHKFLLYGHINRDAPHVAEAICSFANVLSTWSSEREAVDLVDMMIMDAMLETLRCNAGSLLTDDCVCAMFEEAFHMRSRRGSNNILSRFAENVIMQMIMVLFARCVDLQPSDEEIVTARRRSSSAPAPAVSSVEHGVTQAPYGIHALYRVFKFVTGLCNPGDPKNDISTREFGLRMINVALETSGPSLGAHPLLLTVIQDDLCKYLLLNSHTQHLPLFSLALRLVFDLFCALKRHLRVQLEVFFTSIYLRTGESKSVSIDQRELVFESLLEFCHEPSLIVGLYQNYDCEVGSADLFENLVRFLSLHALPPTGQPMQTLNMLALEALLAILESMDTKFNASSQLDFDSNPASDVNSVESADMLKRRQEKKKLEIAAQRFNEEGKSSFSFLQSLHVLPDPITPEAVAKFLFETPNLDKSAVGSYLGSEKTFNQSVLQCYSSSFDFHELSIDDALRKFLDHFMLPKEAQQISRVLEAFSRQFFAHATSPLVNSDAAFILAFSTIMLNTDAHNPQVAKKMTLEEFVRNNRGINDGKDLPKEYLSDLFNSITNNEIRILSTSVSSDSSLQQQQWQKLVEKSRTTGDFDTRSPHALGREMFSLMWDSLGHLFQRAIIIDSNAESLDGSGAANGQQNSGASSNGSLIATETLNREKLVNKIMDGIRISARLCSIYSLHEILNNLVISLCKQLSTMCLECVESAKNLLSSQQSNQPKERMLEITAVLFGQSRPLHRVTTLLFEMINLHGQTHLLDAWSNVLQCILRFRHMNLLPLNLLELDDFVDEHGRPLSTLRSSDAIQLSLSNVLHARPQFDHRNEDQQSESASSGSIFSIWSQINEEEDEEIRFRLELERKLRDSAKETVRQSHIDSLFSASKQFSPQVLNHFISSLLLLGTISWRPGSLPVPPWLIDDVGSEILDEEAASFCLERLWDIFEKNISISKERGHLVWRPIRGHLEWIISSLIPKSAPNQLPPPSFFLERVFVTLFRIVMRLVHLNDNIDEAFQLLSLLSEIDDSYLIAFGSRILAGIRSLLKHCEISNLSSESNWEGMLSILLRFNSLSSFSAEAFETFCLIISQSINKSNFLPALNTLMMYAEPDLMQPVVVVAPPAVVTVTTRKFLFFKTTITQPVADVPTISTRASCEQIVSTLLLLHSKLRSLSASISGGMTSVLIGGEKRRVDITGLWLLSLSAFAKLCRSPRSDVATAATDALQRALLAEDLALHVESPQAWKRCFEMLLMPLMSDFDQALTASTNEQTVLNNLADLRLRISALLFQVLLHQLPVVSLLPDFHIFWLKFIGFLERYMQHKSDERLSIHFTESLKNLLLVMSATNVFVVASQKSGQDLSALTWAVIGTFQPTLRSSLEEALSDVMKPASLSAPDFHTSPAICATAPASHEACISAHDNDITR